MLVLVFMHAFVRGSVCASVRACREGFFNAKIIQSYDFLLNVGNVTISFSKSWK